MTLYAAHIKLSLTVRSLDGPQNPGNDVHVHMGREEPRPRADTDTQRLAIQRAVMQRQRGCVCYVLRELREGECRRQGLILQDDLKDGLKERLPVFAVLAFLELNQAFAGCESLQHVIPDEAFSVEEVLRPLRKLLRAVGKSPVRDREESDATGDYAR